jgi:polyhydroxyalkanoate synthesis regulator protein
MKNSLRSYEDIQENLREQMSGEFTKQEEQAKENIEERVLEQRLLDDIFETWKAGD